MTLVIILGLITIIAAFVQTRAFKRLYAYVERELRRPLNGYIPKVSVILPCKGLDPGFKNNIRLLLDQDYKCDGKPNFEVIFAVASTSDPAYKALEEIRKERSDLKTQMVVAGVNAQRAQKINNQLAALQIVDSQSEVIVFVDSDVIARRDFLRYLVSHLEDAGVGVTTGYRFYIPFKGDWPCLLRSMWNRMTAWEMASARFAFAWGGAMAIRKETFERAGVAASWQKAADDDLSLTTAVKRLGLQVRFIPQCLVVSDGDATIEEIVEWTNRQLILTKVYYPELWRRAINRALILKFWLIAVLLSAAHAVATGDQVSVAACLVGLTLLPVELWFLVKAQGLWRKVILANRIKGTNQEASSAALSAGADKNIELAFDKALLRSILMIPVAHLVLPWMTLYSLLTNRIKWRGVWYELRSSEETIVVSGGNA
ncbi:MAG TPA: glycosyltransferase family 2 protein [Candidatus Obscuribacterales bacterium]